VRQHVHHRVPRELINYLLETKQIQYWPDDARAELFGVVCKLNPSQNSCFRLLWDSLLNGSHPVRGWRLVAACDYKTHVYHVFRNHALYRNKLFVGDGQGLFWLQIPDAILREWNSLRPLNGRSNDAIPRDHNGGPTSCIPMAASA
jgi:hypothetical protein